MGYQVYVYRNGVDFAHIFLGDGEAVDGSGAVNKALEYLVKLNEEKNPSLFIGLAMSVHSIPLYF